MKRYILSLAIMASTMMGCSKIDLDSYTNQTIGTALAVPIGTINVTLSDLYKQFDTIISPQEDEDNTVFVYWEQPVSVEQFNLKDLTKGEKYEGALSVHNNEDLETLVKYLPEGMRIPLPQGSYTLKDTVRYSFNFNEQNPTNVYFIDSVLFRHTTFNLDMNLTDIELDENTYIEAEICFPNLASNKELKFGAIATTDHIKIERITGYFQAGFDRSTTNEVDMYLTFKIVSDGTKTISKNSSIGYSVEFDDIDFEIVHGYIYSSMPICSNHTKITFPESEQLSQFLTDNSIGLYNPQFVISLTTNLGLDATLNVNEVYTISKSEKKNAMFNGEKSFSKIIDTPKRPYDIETFNLTLDRNFGQLNELFRNIPDSLILDWDVYMGQTEEMTHDNFVINPIKLDAKFTMRVPIWFDKGTYIQYDDTLDADLTGINGDWTNIVDIKEFYLFLDFENSLPVHANANLTFMDENDTVLFVKDNFDIACPHVDESGRSTEVAKSEVTLNFTDGEIVEILKTKKIAVKFLLNGYNEESTINFHANDGLKVKVGAYANLSASTSNLTK